MAARVAPSAARIGGFWRKNAFPGGRLTLRTRRSRAASPAQVNIQDVLVITGFSLSIFFVVHVYLNFFLLRSFAINLVFIPSENYFSFLLLRFTFSSF